MRCVFASRDSDKASQVVLVWLTSWDDKRDSVSASHTVTCSASVDLCFESVLPNLSSLWGSKVVTY